MAEEYVLLAVSDSGEGMSDEVLERIFEPFYTTKTAGKGTGLGLAMAYGIIHNHGGHILCESKLGKGSVFKIYLPAIRMEVTEQSEDQGQLIQKGHGETILVIDDEVALRELAEDILKTNGYTIICAGSGEAGLSIYQEKKDTIALILLDLIMPGMGGKHCLQKILEINPNAKVIISSGYSVDDPTTDEILQKARDFIKKPYNFADLLNIIYHNINTT
jgi:CheY-like chemotaxis protein